MFRPNDLIRPKAKLWLDAAAVSFKRNTTYRVRDCNNKRKSYVMDYAIQIETLEGMGVSHPASGSVWWNDTFFEEYSPSFTLDAIDV